MAQPHGKRFAPLPNSGLSMRQDSNEQIPTRASLRAFLGAVIKTDAELNAFCIDYFPEIYKDFSAGMLGTEKYNLLFSSASAPKILRYAKESYQHRYQQYWHLLVFAKEDTPATDGPERTEKFARTYKIAAYVWSAFVMIFMAILAFTNNGKLNFLSERLYFKVNGMFQLGTPVLTLSSAGLRIWRLSMAVRDQTQYRLDIIDPLSSKVIFSESYTDGCGSLSRLMKTEKYVFLVYSCESKAKIFSNHSETVVRNEHDFLRSVGGIETEAANFGYQNEYGDIGIFGKNGTQYTYSSTEDRVTKESNGIDENKIRGEKEISFLRFGRQNDDGKSVWFLERHLANREAFQLFEIRARVDPRWIVSEDIDDLILKNQWKPRVSQHIGKVSEADHFSPKILYQDGDLSLIAYNTNAAKDAPTLLKLLRGKTELLTVQGDICEKYKEILHTYPKTVLHKGQILILGSSATKIDLLSLDPSTGVLSAIYRS